MHARIYDKLIMHADGLVSLPLEIVKRTNNRRCILAVLVANGQRKGGRVQSSKHSNRGAILRKMHQKTRNQVDLIVDY